MTDYPVAVHFDPRFRLARGYWDETEAALLAQAVASEQCDARVMLKERTDVDGNTARNRTLRQAAARLVDSGWLALHLGQWAPGASRLASVTATEKCLEAVPLNEVRCDRLTNPVIGWPACGNLATVTREIETINASIARMDIKCPAQQWWLTKPYGQLPYALEGTSQRSLHRKYYPDGLGGRMFGAFWVNQKRARRADLLLESQPIVASDVEAFNLRVMYRLERVPWMWDWQDPYIAGDGPRTAWKRLTLIMLAARQPLHKWPAGMHATDVDSLAAHGWTLEAAIAAVNAKHGAAIGSRWWKGGTGICERVESDMVVAALLQLHADGIAAIPVHDCIYTSAENAPYARSLMGTIRIHDELSRLVGGLTAK